MDPTQKRILVDLSRDYRDKVKRAAAHMHSMADLADIEDVDVLSAISAVNLYFVVEVVDSTTDMSAEDFGISCADALRERRAAGRRIRRERTQ